MSAANHPSRTVPSDVPSLQIRLFGGLVISINGDHITDLATRKAEALLIYLVCHPHPHQRESLAELLWDDLPAERAAANLRQILNQLRKRLAPFLDISRHTIAIRHDIKCWLDVDEFARLLATDPHDIATLARVLELYRGDFLQGFHLRDARGFSEWQEAQVDHRRQRALAAMRLLAEQYMALGNYTEGLAWATRLLAIDPLDEATHRQKMLLLARSGQRNAAVRQYQACKQTLQEELGLDPEPATEALVERIRAMPAERPHRLPLCHGPLIGRSAELARVYEWLAVGASRLLTLAGPGGSGKTQLALTAGWRAAREFIGPCDDGVFYIPLLANDLEVSRIEDDALLVTIAEALRIKLSSQHALIDQMVRALCDKELLIILDNGELLAPSARLALGTLIQHTHTVRVLVPSHERLKIREENLLNIDGLDYPTVLPSHPARLPDQALLAGIPQFASVRLFLEHAHRVEGITSFDAYNERDQIAIGRICRMVRGLPLAIDLAASWLHVRAPHEIAQDIAQTIDLLVTDMPEVPKRHRSMRAVFEHSWRLMTAREQVALVNLAVFPGSFTADAARAIASTGLLALAALHDKSLIQSLPSTPDTRYLLHPLLRQLAQEKLRADPAAEALIQTHHARYFATFAGQCEEQLHGSQGVDTLNALERDIDNLRAGWRWAITTGDLAMLGQYSLALHDLCSMRNWEIEGRQLFHQAAAIVRAWIASPDASPAGPLAAVRVLSCYGALQYILGEIPGAEVALQQSQALLAAYAIDALEQRMFVPKFLGLIAYWRGAYADAIEYLHSSLSLVEAAGDQYKIADILLSIGAVAYTQGDCAYAQQVLQRCLAIHHALDYQWGIGHTRRFLGMVAALRGNLRSAHQYYEESLVIAQQSGNRVGEALALDQIGMLYLAERQIECARDALQRGVGIFQELGIELGSGRALYHLARVALAGHNYDETRQYLLQAVRIAERIQAPSLLIECAAAAGQLQLEARAYAVAEHAVSSVLAALWWHPACSADTRHYIESFIPEGLAAYAAGAGGLYQPWTLEQIQGLVRGWMGGMLEAELVSGAGSSI